MNQSEICEEQITFALRQALDILISHYFALPKEPLIAALLAGGYTPLKESWQHYQVKGAHHAGAHALSAGRLPAPGP